VIGFIFSLLLNSHSFLLLLWPYRSPSWRRLFLFFSRLPSTLYRNRPYLLFEWN